MFKRQKQASRKEGCGVYYDGEVASSDQMCLALFKTGFVGSPFDEQSWMSVYKR
jgi:hypothetical protein